ncbi:hypothetical protein RvY_07327-2 [Ramazzottius varieornatus]|nr:hypothetical protein RvY_07327-2 [Ramazzottius varieornatus]
MIQETAAAGTFITRVSAVDPNGLALTWSIPDTSLQTFSINPTTGDIFTTVNITTLNVTRSFHRQARSVLEFLVRATNSAGQTCDSLVRINILTATKPQVTVAIFNGSASGSATATAAPTWTLARYSFTTRVCKSGSIVASITANNGPTSYAILGNSDYDIDNNGNIKISSSVSPGAQTFVVGATNNLGTAYTLVTIRTKSCPAGVGSANVNLAGAPVFSQEAYSVTITDCRLGAPVGTLSATNANTYAVISDTLKYSISYDGTIGIVNNPDLGSTTTVIIGAYNGIGAAFTSVTITANCNNILGTAAPTATLPVIGTVPVIGSVPIIGTNPVTPSSTPGFMSTSYTFTASSCSSGTVVGSVSAGSGPRYAIAAGGTGFAIDPTSGSITINGPVISGTQAFLVSAASTTGTFYATVTVNALCTGGSGGVPSSSGFTQTTYNFNPPTCQPGSPVGTVTAGGNPSYTIAGGGSGFSINPQTGAITVTGTNIVGSQALLIQAVGASTSSYATAIVSCGQAQVIPSQPAPSFGSFPMQNPPVIGPAPSTSYGQPQYSGSQYPMNNNIPYYEPGRGDPYAKSAAIPTGVVFDKPKYHFSIRCSPGYTTSRVGVVTAHMANLDIGAVNYSLNSDNFYIDSNTGEIRTQVYRPVLASQTFEVSATGSTPGAKAIATVNVDVSGIC